MREKSSLTTDAYYKPHHLSHITFWTCASPMIRIHWAWIESKPVTTVFQFIRCLKDGGGGGSGGGVV
jgi:hypothetical protein